MPQDILSDLKAKEDELDALVEGARQKAASIREEGRRKADGIMTAHASSIDDELEEMRRARDAETTAKIADIERESASAVEELKARCESNIDRAVAEVTRLISGEDG